MLPGSICRFHGDSLRTLKMGWLMLLLVMIRRSLRVDAGVSSKELKPSGSGGGVLGMICECHTYATSSVSEDVTAMILAMEDRWVMAWAAAGPG